MIEIERMNADYQVVVRVATLDDIAAMAAITREVFGPVSMDQHAQRIVGPAGAPWYEIKGKVVGDEVRANPGGCFVAQIDGLTVGYVTTVINQMPRRGIISNLAVAAGAQGKGVGRKLIQRAVEHFKAIGLVQARIDTLDCNEVGKHLYPALGFKEVAREIHYFMSLDAPQGTGK